MRIVFLFICMLFVIGCGKKIDTTIVYENEIKIDPESTLDSVSFSEIFEGISYIQISTDNDFLIGRIDKIVPCDDRIFILDRKLSRSVFCIDKEGNKIFELHRLGKGPGEYVELKDIAYDVRREELVLYCPIRQRLMWFDLSGKFLREKAVPVWASGVQPLKNGGVALFCDYSPEKKLEQNGFYPNVVVLDSNMNIVSQSAYFKGIVDKGIVWSSRPDFSYFTEMAGVMPDHSNTIYHIRNNDVVAWKLDFGQNDINEQYWEQVFSREMTLEKLNEYCRVQGLCESVYYMENEKVMCFAYRYKGRYFQVFYSKETGRLLNTGKFVNDLNHFGGFAPQALCRQQFYGHISASIVSDCREKLKEFKVMPEKILNTIEMSDNPVLVVYTLKGF